MNGSGSRKCHSWIESFVEHTDNIDAPESFRRWAAIATIASVLEQKVWLKSGGSQLYPNLYIFIIGHPGTGKTRTIRAVRSYLMELSEFHLAPTSLTAASLVDIVADAKRFIAQLPNPPLDYNSTCIMADELGTFIHKYDDEMIAVLSAFYDPDPYAQNRRTKDIKIKIKRPQLNMLCGSTPSNLLKFIPEGAWDQGFTSRTIMVFSDERIIGDDFATVVRTKSEDLLHDLKLINSLVGEAGVTEDYRNLVNMWRQGGELPAPSHPKLLHYNTRRRAHFYKLSMVAAIDRSNTLLLTREDFNTAMNWLTQAEELMPEIFKAGAIGADAAAMDEIYHFVMITDTLGKGIREDRIVRFAAERIPSHSVIRVFEIMERAGRITLAEQDRMGVKFWKATPQGQ